MLTSTSHLPSKKIAWTETELLIILCVNIPYLNTSKQRISLVVKNKTSNVIGHTDREVALLALRALRASHFCLCSDLLVYHTLHIHTTQSSLNSHGNLPLAGWPDANLPLRHNREAQYLVTVTRVVHETECTRVSVADKILPSIFYGRIYV